MNMGSCAVARERWAERHLRRPDGIPPMLMAVVTMLATLSGCGPAGTIVSGVVTLDDRPLDDAVIQFFPVGGDGQTSHAFTDKKGAYRVKVSAVPLLVTVSKGKVVGQAREFPDAPLVDVLAESLPPRYSVRAETELRVEPVTDKTTTADFALTSAAK
jgi:hypothetical protein